MKKIVTLCLALILGLLLVACNTPPENVTPPENETTPENMTPPENETTPKPELSRGTVENGVYQNEYFHHLDGLYLEAEDAAHYDLLFETVHVLQSRFPDTNIINTTENGIYAVFGENFCPLFNNSGDFYYTEYPTWLAEYIASDMPIIIGPEAPDGYMLYVEIPGDGGDDFVGSHRMPANIYLPTALYEALVP